MKLKLKNLAPYLPYELGIKPIWRSIYMGGYSQKELTTYILDNYELDEIKPILRPLSDLRKEEFNYLYTLLRVHIGKNKRDKLINEGYGITDLPYFIFEQLLENHFDMFNLIKNDLAVDINTL